MYISDKSGRLMITQDPSVDAHLCSIALTCETLRPDAAKMSTSLICPPARQLSDSAHKLRVLALACTLHPPEKKT
jgi:hypothetical protein